MTSWAELYNAWLKEECSDEELAYRIATVTEFGPEDEMLYIWEALEDTDSSVAQAFLIRALNAGVHFSFEGVFCVLEHVPEEVFLWMIGDAQPPLTADEVEELYWEAEDSLYRKICDLIGVVPRYEREGCSWEEFQELYDSMQTGEQQAALASRQQVFGPGEEVAAIVWDLQQSDPDAAGDFLARAVRAGVVLPVEDEEADSIDEDEDDFEWDDEFEEVDEEHESSPEEVKPAIKSASTGLLDTVLDRLSFGGTVAAAYVGKKAVDYAKDKYAKKSSVPRSPFDYEGHPSHWEDAESDLGDHDERWT